MLAKIYDQHRAAFANVSAFVIAKDGEGKAGWSLPQAIHKGRTIAARIAAMLDQSAVLFSVEELHAEFVETAEVSNA